MRVGTIRETKVEEYRVGLTPAAARSLTLAGHEVFVEGGAGEGSGYADQDYEAAGAVIRPGGGGLPAPGEGQGAPALAVRSF